MKSRITNIESLGIVKEINGKVIEIQKEGEIPSDFVLSSGEEQTDEFHEGKMTRVFINKFERNKDTRKKCIEHYGAICRACDCDFFKKYGEIGKGFIHVHHLKPLHDIRKEYEVDPIEDLIPVCPNCHAMLHHKGTSDTDMTVEQLKELIKKNEKG